MAVFTGTGLTSQKRAFMRSRYFSWRVRESFVFPSFQRATMSWVSFGTTFERTLITPLPPRERMGTIWSSLPE